MSEILIAAGSGILTLVIVAAANALRTGSSLPRRVTRLEEGIVMLIEVNEGQTDGIIASLVAQKEGRCNGEVTTALDSLRASKAKSRAFLAAKAVGAKL